MATMKLGHRRNGSGDGPTVFVTQGQNVLTLDGSMLEGLKDGVQRGLKEEHQHGQPKGKQSRPAPLNRAPASDKVPMTPPRVAGISLAPLPDDHSAAPPKAQGRPSQPSIPLGGKAPHASTGAACGGAAAANGGGSGAPGGGLAGTQQLIAEGRSIQRGVPLDPRIAAYNDINGHDRDRDSDSLCSTPPALSMQMLTRPEGNGAFGPLSPCPMSPSILTLCGQPGVDDQFEFAPPVGGGGSMWDGSSTAELLDMRMCQSPRLPSA
ncbi:hypothetical protein TSOC_002021 [Tetrabaena socialis]|uniref:Uncharacterized protein n=1 Tax=Tetrabaena socialis TaxID=47790 RepID=A0A2J8AF84_9CHLO|nr:hypothetical protein TSOC_002021 [Tetrabaena socialis]|eukprot:PNH11179.1 hypothetical protein TSOC_002021 [Tetrabaena socialis]